MSNQEEVKEKHPEENVNSEKKIKAKPPIVILSVAGAILLVIGLVFLLLKLWEGSGEFRIDTSLDTETETDDRVTFLPTSLSRTNDDGVTTVVIFGNDTFGDSTGGPSVVDLLKKNTSATIYDLTLPGSTMIATKQQAPSDSGYTKDYFCLYWMWESFMNGDFSYQINAIDDMDGIDKDLYRERFKTFASIDFEKVDYILIAYDGHDYLAGHKSIISGAEYSPACMNGIIYGMYEKAFYRYPEVQIAFVAPCFCYARDIQGQRVGGDIHRIDGESLTTSIQLMKDATASYGISYVDDYFGVAINAETAEKYLTKDDVVPNQEGKKLIAAHILNKVFKRIEAKEGETEE